MLADRIGQLRQERRWPQSQLGEVLGVHRKHLSASEFATHAASTGVSIESTAASDGT